MTTFELSNTASLGSVLNHGEHLGGAVLLRPDIGCQLVSIVKPKESRRGPKDQMLIAIEPGGRSPFITLTTDKRVIVWPVAGRAYGVARRVNGTLLAQPLNPGITGGERLLRFGKGDSFGFVNVSEGLCAARDEFYPN